MKRQFIASALLLLLATIAHAQAESATDVYLCVDDQGHKEYKNTGGIKGCKKVDLPGITTIPGLPKKASAASNPKASTPVEFPKVDGNTQKTRDNDRKQILLDEMKTEEQKLANLKKDFNSGEPERNGDERNFAKYQERVTQMKDDIARSEKNIEALKREVANMK